MLARIPIPSASGRDQRGMGREIIASRRFTSADQLAFARLSDDHNPMHLDEVAARRTQAGAPVVHGVHAVLWALDALAARGMPLARTAGLNARFVKFMYLDTDIEIANLRETGGGLAFELATEGQTAATVTVRLADERLPARIKIPAEVPTVSTAASKPNTMTFTELAGLTGWLDPVASAAEWSALFPAAGAAITGERLAALGQLSRLVGMISPGLHSIFSSFAVDFTPDAPDRRGMGFKVVTCDSRYRIVKMEVEGGDISGKVTTFMRQPPIETPSVAALRAHLDASACAGSTSLLVGASRGLGAVTAKLLAAAGGRVIVTYARGQDDAEKLADEINAACGARSCTTRALDVRDSVAPQLASLAEPVSHLYYFATPQIFRQRAADVFSPALFAEFSRFYVDAFWEAIAALTAEPRPAPLSVFYPSSVAVDERPPGMTEYAMAKIAGETLCADLARSSLKLSLLVSRLPRTLTDQTASLAEVKSADPVSIMLPLIREIHGHRQRAA